MRRGNRTIMLAFPAIAFALALGVVGTSDAFAFSGYKCIVNAYYTLQEGQLKQSPLSNLVVGTEFIVDRSNGKLLGTPSTAFGWERTEVLDKGSDAQNFKSLYVSSGFVHVMLLTIKEIDPGPSKSFLLLDGTNFSVGLCAQLR